MAEALEYLAAAVIDQMQKANADEIDSFDAIRNALGRPYGINIDQETTEILARRLEQLGFIRRVQDEYAGIYFVPVNSLTILLKTSSLQTQDPGSRLAKALSGGKGLFNRVFRNDRFWSDLQNSIRDGLSPDEPNDGAADKGIIPASDRIVTLSHNQQLELENASTELADTLARENSIDGDIELKDRLVGQVRAARELIRAQSVRAYLLYESVFTILGGLVERYKEHAIGYAAKKLLDLLIEHVLKK